MTTKITFAKVEKGKDFVSPKTGEAWWFWNLTDEKGDKYSIPSFSITFSPEERKEYEIEFTVEKTGKWTNRKITKIGSVRNETGNNEILKLVKENNEMLHEIIDRLDMEQANKVEGKPF